MQHLSTLFKGLLFAAMMLPNAGVEAQSIVTAEYFFDIDPGQGAGTVVAIASADTVDVSGAALAAGLDPGLHAFCFRVKDDQGVWSMHACRPVYVIGQGPQVVVDVVAAEYFFDTDPGPGSATAITVAQAADSVFLDELRSAAGLALGDHSLCVRVADASGTWSLSSCVTFSICETYGPLASFNYVRDNLNLSFSNSSTDFETCLWEFGDDSTSTLVDPFHTYSGAGVYDVCLTAYNACLPDGHTTCASVTINGLSSIHPRIGGNQGGVTIDVSGAGFTNATSFRLVREDDSFVVPDTLFYGNTTSIRASLDLIGVEAGLWNVEVVIAPDTFLLVEGFEVISGHNSDSLITVSLMARPFMRIGFEQLYTVVCQNNGFNDAVAVPLWLTGLPIGSQVSVLNGYTPLDSIPEVGVLEIPWDSIPTVFVDSTSMTAYHFVILPVIPPQSAFTVVYAIRTPADLEPDLPFELTAHVHAPLLQYGDVFSRDDADLDMCMSGLLDIAVAAAIEATGLPDWINCLGGEEQLELVLGKVVRKAVRQATGYTIVEGGSAGVLPELNPVIDAGDAVVSRIERARSCVSALFGTIPVWKTVRILNKVIDEWNKANDALGSVTTTIACARALRKFVKSSLWLRSSNSMDPNDKFGPGAQSVSHYVNSEGAYAYTIAFENDPEAGLAAQFVTVIDSLDVTKFDLTTFGFTFATVGNAAVATDGLAKSMVRELETQEVTGMNTRVVASLDTVTGIATWQFFTIDPTTGQVTTDPLAGFLPPDTLSPLGQGYVGFVVRPRNGLQESDTISNRATIIFDYNTPITTPPWSTIVDNVSPTSAVSELPLTVSADSVWVQWSGTDAVSGIQVYTLMVSKDGEPYEPWLSGTADTSSWFHGDLGSTYRFYSLATDSAGNMELPPDDFDAIVDLDVSISGVGDIQFGAVILPNPNEGLFRLKLFSSSQERSTLTITNMLGSPVLQEMFTLSAGRGSRDFDLTALANGTYLITLQTSKQRLTLSWVKN